MICVVNFLVEIGKIVYYLFYSSVAFSGRAIM